MFYLLENQETDRLKFRRIKLSDFNIWLAFFKNPDASKFWIFDEESPEFHCQKWYANQIYRYDNNLGGMNALIQKSSGNLIGHCGLLIQNVDDTKELEIGYSLLPQYWKKGYAIEAAKKCRDYAFENNLFESLISIISLQNKPSEKVAIKNGMKVDKVTDYKNNRVNIYRINKVDWEKL